MTNRQQLSLLLLSCVCPAGKKKIRFPSRTFLVESKFYLFSTPISRVSTPYIVGTVHEFHTRTDNGVRKIKYKICLRYLYTKRTGRFDDESWKKSYCDRCRTLFATNMLLCITAFLQQFVGYVIVRIVKKKK